MRPAAAVAAGAVDVAAVTRGRVFERLTFGRALVGRKIAGLCALPAPLVASRPALGRRHCAAACPRPKSPRSLPGSPVTSAASAHSMPARRHLLETSIQSPIRGPELECREVPTFAEFSGMFIDTYAKTNNRASTVREKSRALKRGLHHELGDLRLDRIGGREVEAFKARRKADGVANKTINEELAILAKILDYAVEIGDLTTPPPRIRRLKTQQPSFDFFDFEETERLFEAVRDVRDPWCAMIPIAVLTGLRLSKLRGLQWDDVDLVAARIHVRRAADDEGDLHADEELSGSDCRPASLGGHDPARAQTPARPVRVLPGGRLDAAALALRVEDEEAAGRLPADEGLPKSGPAPHGLAWPSAHLRLASGDARRQPD